MIDPYWVDPRCLAHEHDGCIGGKCMCDCHKEKDMEERMMRTIVNQIEEDAAALDGNNEELVIAYAKYIYILLTRIDSVLVAADLAAQDFPHGQIPYRVRKAISALLMPAESEEAQA